MVVFIEGGYCIFPPKLCLLMCTHYLILLNFFKSFFLVVVLYFLVVFWPWLRLSLHPFLFWLFGHQHIELSMVLPTFQQLHCLFNNIINERGWVSYGELWRSRRVLSVEAVVYGSHIETLPNHFKVVDCYFFGTGSPWSCLLTPKRGNTVVTWMKYIYALYIVQVKCTCFLASVVLFVQDIEWFKLHRIKLLCLKFYFDHNHQWNLIWFKLKIEGLKMKFQTVNESC